MVADPFRRGNGDRASPRCLAVLNATCVGIIAIALAGCAKDVRREVRQHTDRVAELQLPIPRQPIPRHTGDAVRPPLFQHASEMQQTPPREANRIEPLGNTAKLRPPLATSASPSPRPHSSEKSNIGPLTPTQRERLFEEFLQWQKRTTIQGMLAIADDTNEAPGDTSSAGLPPAANAPASPRLRVAEKSNEGQFSSTRKERLFEAFLQWQRRTTIQGILAMTADTNQAYAIVGDMR